MFPDIFGHNDFNITLVVIPLEIYAAVEVVKAILNNLVGFLANGIVEVLEVLFPNAFDAEVVDGKIEPDGSGFMFPEAGSVWLFMISVASKAFFKSFNGKAASLRETVHDFLISM